MADRRANVLSGIYFFFSVFETDISGEKCLPAECENEKKKKSKIIKTNIGFSTDKPG